jgi:ribose 5-phosphate isomerase B
MKKKVFLASDHGGFKYREALRDWLTMSGDYDVLDLGNKVFNPEDDYPDFIIPLAKKVTAEIGSFGITLGRSGNGEAIAANKVYAAKAAHCTTVQMAVKAREDNDANILAIGADYLSLDEAKQISKAFLETPFSNLGRHKRRIDKILSYKI